MPVIFQVYANTEGEDSLEFLDAERIAVNDNLWNWNDQDGNRLSQMENPTIDTFLGRLTRNDVHKELIILSFSGHAHSDQLIINNESARGQIIAKLLDHCPNLKLVLLNGCSTWGHLEHLEGADIPIIISTSNPVGDERAKTFADAFFKELYRGKIISEAFDIASLKVKTPDNREKFDVRTLSHPFTRTASWVGAAQENTFVPAQWMIRFKEDHFKDWKLSMGTDDPSKAVNTNSRSTLFDLQTPNIDYAPVCINRHRMIGEWTNFWETQCDECTTLQFFLQANASHRPISMIERFRRLLEDDYDRVVTYHARETTQGAAKIPMFYRKDKLSNPVGLVNQLRQGAGPNDIIFLPFSINLESCSPRNLLQLKALVEGKWLKDLDDVSQKIVFFYELQASEPKGMFGRIFGKSKSQKKLDHIRKAIKNTEHSLWSTEWEHITLEHLHQWAREYTTRIDLVEQAARTRLGKDFPLPMSDIEGFIKDIIRREVA